MGFAASLTDSLKFKVLILLIVPSLSWAETTNITSVKNCRTIFPDKGLAIIDGHRVNANDTVEDFLLLAGLPVGEVNRVQGSLYSLADTSSKELLSIAGGLLTRARTWYQNGRVELLSEVYNANRFINELLFQRSMQVGDLAKARNFLARLFAEQNLFLEKPAAVAGDNKALLEKAMQVGYFGDLTGKDLSTRFSGDFFLRDQIRTRYGWAELEAISSARTPGQRLALRIEHNRRYQELVALQTHFSETTASERGAAHIQALDVIQSLMRHYQSALTQSLPHFVRDFNSDSSSQ